MTFWTICPILSFEVIKMTDYKKLYLTMFRASEKAIELLIEAQRKCEEEVRCGAGGRLLKKDSVPRSEQIDITFHIERV